MRNPLPDKKNKSYRRSETKTQKNHSFWEFATTFTDYLELGKSFAMQFLCSIAVQIMEEFYLSCSCILGILDELLIHKRTLKKEELKRLNFSMSIFISEPLLLIYQTLTLRIHSSNSTL